MHDKIHTLRVSANTAPREYREIAEVTLIQSAAVATSSEIPMSESRLSRWCTSALVALALSVPVSAAAEGLQLATGFDYSRGRYGSTTTTEIAAAIVQGRYEHGPYLWQATLPYLLVRGSGVIVGGGDSLQVVPQADVQRDRAAGLGDIVVGLNYAAYYDAQSGLALDVGGKVKLPTADSGRGLGTGKTDVTWRVQALQEWGKATGMLGVGYKWIGKPAGSDYRNVALVSVGAALRVSVETSAGVLLDFRQSVVRSLPAERELTLYLNQQLARQWKVQAYVYGGASESSPDFGFGATLAYQL